MLKRVLSCLTCAVIPCALVLGPPAARATPLPTVTITSASGYAVWNGGNLPYCSICASLYSPEFTLNFQGDVTNPYYYQAPPGFALDMAFYLATQPYGESQNPPDHSFSPGLTIQWLTMGAG
jgi:hypothetical protein